MTRRHFVVLDRDGTIIVERHYLSELGQVALLSRVASGLRQLREMGLGLVVVTNQSGVGRGLFGMPTLTEIHDKMFKSLHQVGGRIDAVFYCPHAADSNCDCRKPKPGMLQQIGVRFGVDLDHVPVVGDGLRDLQAAAAIGARPILVLTGKGEKTHAAGDLPEGTMVFPDLAFAVTALLAEA